VSVIIDFILEDAEAKEINLALDMIRTSENQDISGGHALVRLARFYPALISPRFLNLRPWQLALSLCHVGTSRNRGFESHPALQVGGGYPPRNRRAAAPT